MRVIKYIPRVRTPLIIMNYERLLESNFYLSPGRYTERKEMFKQRIEAIIEFARNDTVCRSRQLIEYFGQPAGLLSHPQQRDEPPVVELLEALQRLRQASSPFQFAGDPCKGDAVRIKHDDPLEHPDALQQRDSGGSKQAEQAAETGLHALFQRVARQRNLQQPSAGEPLYARAE